MAYRTEWAKSLEDRSEEQWPKSRLRLSSNLVHFCWDRGHLAVILKSHFHSFPGPLHDIQGKTHLWITCLWHLRKFDHLCMMIHKRCQSNIVSVAAKSPEKREERASVSLMWDQALLSQNLGCSSPQVSPACWDLKGHHRDVSSGYEQRLGEVPVGTQVCWRARLHAL